MQYYFYKTIVYLIREQTRWECLVFEQCYLGRDLYMLNLFILWYYVTKVCDVDIGFQIVLFTNITYLKFF